MLGVSRSGVALKGTVFRARSCCFPDLDFTHSTSLPPFAPPVFATRLHRYYEGSDFRHLATKVPSCPVALWEGLVPRGRLGLAKSVLPAYLV